MLALFRGLDDDQWQTPSRCSEWTVQDVVRHLVDVANMDIALQRGEEPRNEGGRIDPRNDPGRWLAASQGQSPSETVADFESMAQEERSIFRERIRDAGDELLPGPYGPLHWSSLAAHLFWDAWLHERDIAFPLDLEPDASLAENRLAALYGLAIASVAPTFFDSTVTLAIEMTGFAPGVYEIAAITPEKICVDFRGAGTKPAMRAELGTLIDSLAGRGPEVADVLEPVADVDESVDVEPLTLLRGLLLPTD
jgi:uncharacterized protein (TIGR03083 family)